MKHDFKPQRAVDFLRKLQENGTWSLTALGQDHSANTSARFNPDQTEALIEWLKAQSIGKRDTYFRCALARICTGKDGAMVDEDVNGLTCLWCDIDIPSIKKSTDTASRQLAKDAALAQFKEKTKTIPPTFIVDSGNGLHAYWKLERIAMIGPGFTLADLSAYLYGMAKKFGGDTKCKNPSRLLRVPFTVNVKNPAFPIPCRLIEENSKTYRLSDFEGFHDDSFLSKAPIAIAEIDPAPLVDLSTLDLPEGLRQKIETGIDPKTGLTWTDRSQLMNHIAVELVKIGIDPSIILSIIMDSRYHHGGHIAECRDPLREGRRTLNWALNRGSDDSTSRLNRNFFMVCVGGRMFFGWDDEGQLTAVSPREICNVEDFKREIAPIKEFVSVTDKKTGKVVLQEINVFNKWIEDENRRRFYPKGYTIDPHRSHDNGYYNLWKGFAVRSNKGLWPLMQENIRCLCEEDAAYYIYVMNWAAMLVQQPTALPRTALVFHGDQGTGKTLFASALSRLFGPHSYKIDKPKQLVGQFTGHLDSKIFIHAEECQFDHTGLGVLKSMVTDEMVSIERKGAQAYQARNYAHVMVTTNNEHVLPVEPGNRRFVIFRPSRVHKGDTDFWTALVAEMQSGGYEAMLYDLLHRDIKGWNPEATKPETESMRQHKLDTMSPAQAAVKYWLESRDRSPLALNRNEGRYKVNAREMDQLLRFLGVDIIAGTTPEWSIVQDRWMKATGNTLGMKP